LKYCLVLEQRLVFEAFVGAPPSLPSLWTTQLPPAIIDDDGQGANSAESGGDEDNGGDDLLFAKMPPRPCIHNKKMNILRVFYDLCNMYKPRGALPLGQCLLFGGVEKGGWFWRAVLKKRLYVMLRGGYRFTEKIVNPPQAFQPRNSLHTDDTDTRHRLRFRSLPPKKWLRHHLLWSIIVYLATAKKDGCAKNGPNTDDTWKILLRSLNILPPKNMVAPPWLRSLQRLNMVALNTNM
jgi:hypothetical protein